MLVDSNLRSLDTEIRSHCRACTENFDYRRLSFVLEGKGIWQDQQLEAAQTKANSALRRSQASAFELFKTNLEQDQMLRRRYISASSGDESRARAAIIESLEDPGSKQNTKTFGRTFRFYTFVRVQVDKNISLFACFCMSFVLLRVVCADRIAWANKLLDWEPTLMFNHFLVFTVTRLAENAWDCLEDGLVLLPRLYPYLVQHATAEAKREWFSRPLNAEECLMFTWQPASVFEKGMVLRFLWHIW